MNENAAKGTKESVPFHDDSPEARRQRPEKRRKAMGSLQVQISLSMEEALAPLDPEELAAWEGD